MGLGIIPFLIQWVALNHFGKNQHPTFTQFPPKSHWALLSDLQQLPEEEIEDYLPQLCNILLDREAEIDYGLYNQFEQVLIEKCANCLPFGLRVCGLLKAASSGPSENLFSHVLSNNNGNAREDRLRRLQEHVESATAHGYNLPYRLSSLRSTYFNDFRFMMETLTRLGTELKSSPVTVRNGHLRDALSQFNNLLYTRMITKGSLEQQSLLPHELQIYTPQQILSQMPSIASFSLHLPIQRTKEDIQRLLHIVENECEVLPSKERCPYLLVVEVQHEAYPIQSEELYSHGHVLGVTIEDILLDHSLPPTSPERYSIKENENDYIIFDNDNNNNNYENNDYTEYLLKDAPSSIYNNNNDNNMNDNNNMLSLLKNKILYNIKNNNNRNNNNNGRISSSTNNDNNNNDSNSDFLSLFARNGQDIIEVEVPEDVPAISGIYSTSTSISAATDVSGGGLPNGLGTHANGYISSNGHTNNDHHQQQHQHQ
eukprot:gene12156-25509_t